MSADESASVFEEDDPPGPVQARARLSERQRRVAIANFLRLKYFASGREIRPIHILIRVEGTTCAEIESVRAELGQQGVLTCEVSPENAP